MTFESLPLPSWFDLRPWFFFLKWMYIPFKCYCNFWAQNETENKITPSKWIECFSHDILSAVLVSQTIIFVVVKPFSYVNALFCFDEFCMSASHSYRILNIVEDEFQCLLRAASQLTDITLIRSPLNVRDVFNRISPFGPPSLPFLVYSTLRTTLQWRSVWCWGRR